MEFHSTIKPPIFRCVSRALRAGLRLFLPLLVCGLIGGGCATTSSAPSALVPEKRAKLIRTQAGDRVTLQWASKVGVSYTVIYTHSLEQRRAWKPLPEFSGIRGTGSTMTITFLAPEPGALYYRLRESGLTGP